MTRKVTNHMKLIATDLDGTLLSKDHEISKENINALQQAAKNGIEVVVATGRAYFDARSICEKFGLYTHLITYNGAAIHSKEGQSISSLTMDKDDVKHAVNWLAQRDYYYEVSTDQNIYIPSNGKEILQQEVDGLKGTKFELDAVTFQNMLDKIFSQSGIVAVDKPEDIMGVDEGFYKVFSFSFNEEKRDFGMNKFAGMEQLSMISSFANNFEMGHKQASKGNALEILASKLQIPLSQAMAIGDNYNDVSMMEKVKYSVAMGNANDDIKAYCSFVTNTNEESGVAYAIQEIIAANAYL
jgi:Cof subfamily protein (haloacid dehalogenase superfamily)